VGWPVTHGDANYMNTISGRKFWPLDPRAEDVDIRDIAHALANLCRFNGHVRKFYSVAQHSVIVSQVVPPEFALYGLLHDAAEAYIGDMTRPLKHDPKMARFKECDIRLSAVIYQRFGLGHEEPPCVKAADRLVLQDEVRDVALHTERGSGYVHGAGTGRFIHPQCPDEAKHSFIFRFHQLYGIRD
jgi:hypothetical protein